MKSLIVLIFGKINFETKRDNFNQGPVETPSGRGLPIEFLLASCTVQLMLCQGVLKLGFTYA